MIKEEANPRQKTDAAASQKTKHTQMENRKTRRIRRCQCNSMGAALLPEGEGQRAVPGHGGPPLPVLRGVVGGQADWAPPGPVRDPPGEGWGPPPKK